MKELTPQILGVYYGCKCNVSASDFYDEMTNATIVGFDADEEVIFIRPDGWKANRLEVDRYDVQLVLRPLSSITEEEFKESGAYDESLEKLGVALLKDQHLMFNREARAKEDRCWFPDTYLFFTSRGFDLFNLIPSGLAIDATTIK